MKFLSTENLILAYKNALKSRKTKHEIYIFNQNLEKNLKNILSDLQNRIYTHWSYKYFSLCDSKKRYISSPIFRDHILHHMIYNICYDVLDKRMIYNSFATRKWKWLHQWLHYIVSKIKSQKNNQNLWYLKIDISKYFYSINHDVLKQKISKYIKNSDVLYAIQLVINSYQTSSLFDSLFAKQSDYRKTKSKWVPIWALYSQLFANFYLSEIDRYIVQQIKPQIYARYMDDFVFLDTKERLQQIKLSVIKKIEEHKLVVVPKKTQINTLKHWISFLWFKIQSIWSKLHISVNSKNKKKFRKSVDTIKSLEYDHISRQDKKRIISVFESRKWIFKHTGDTERYFKNLPNTPINLQNK